MKKLAVITTHPIQYNAPLFELLSKRKVIDIRVFYTWENAKNGIFDNKFKQNIAWDIPLLSGYNYQFVKNTAKNQGSHHRKGIINPTLIQDIENWQANAILVYGWNYQSHFKAMRYFKGKIPVLFRGDSTLLDEEFGLKTILRRIFLKFVYRYIDYALYVGTNNQNYFLKHGVRASNLIFAPHSIDNKRFANTSNNYEVKAEKWRNKLKISDKDIVFLFAGKFESKKNPLLIVEIAKRLQNYKFILAGSGNLEAKIKSESIKLNNIILLPFQNQSVMPVLYRLSDVFMLPSKGPGETWGLSINEAMACKKAIFASSKVGCAVDLVKDGESGFIFDPDNINELTKKIKSLSKNQILQMGLCSSKIIEKYSLDKICEVVESTVKNC